MESSRRCLKEFAENNISDRKSLISTRLDRIGKVNHLMKNYFYATAQKFVKTFLRSVKSEIR
jgi:hypothetical protein